MKIEIGKTEQLCAIQDVMRSAFLHVKFPILPYCEYHRGPSTQYSESFHIGNKTTGLQVNFWWSFGNKVSISTYDTKEKDPWKKNKTIRVNIDGFSNELIDNVCRRFLADA